MRITDLSKDFVFLYIMINSKQRNCIEINLQNGILSHFLHYTQNTTPSNTQGYCLDTTQPVDRLKQNHLQLLKQRQEAEEVREHAEAQAAKLVAALRDPTDPNSTPPEPVKTEDGKECQFPFVYKQKPYYDCINMDEPSGRYWCSTSDTHNFDQQPLKGFCLDERFPKPIVDPEVVAVGGAGERENIFLFIK